MWLADVRSTSIEATSFHQYTTCPQAHNPVARTEKGIQSQHLKQHGSCSLSTDSAQRWIPPGTYAGGAKPAKKLYGHGWSFLQPSMSLLSLHFLSGNGTSCLLVWETSQIGSVAGASFAGVSGHCASGAACVWMSCWRRLGDTILKLTRTNKLCYYTFALLCQRPPL